MPISEWPVAERPREKLLLRGAEALSDAELLAIFLRTGVAGKTAVDLARELLAEFGSLRDLLTAKQEAFCSAPGLGKAKYAQLQAVLEMGRRYLAENMQRGKRCRLPAIRNNISRPGCAIAGRKSFAVCFLIIVIIF